MSRTPLVTPSSGNNDTSAARLAARIAAHTLHDIDARFHSESSAGDSDTPQPKTIDEHAELLREYVRLQLWFLWTWLHRYPSESFQHAIRYRVDIFRKTDLNKGPSKSTGTPQCAADSCWLELEDAAFRAYLHLVDEDADLFEREAWLIFQPVVEARVERDFRERIEGYQCGGLRYDEPRRFPSQRLAAGISYLKHGRPRTVFFHVANPLAPRSIFCDREYLPGCFFQLMAETRAKFCVGALTTATWLNSHPRWLQLFPEQWRANLSAPSDDVHWSQSWWGQFISARGTFNYKHAAVLRRTGQFPYRPHSSWCTFKEMEKHLLTYLSET